MTEKHSHEEVVSTSEEIRSQSYRDRPNLVGIILIVLGALFLIDNFFPAFDFGMLWPVLLIVGGIVIMMRKED